MKKNIISVCEVPERTIGIDLSDRTFRYCALNREGKIVEEGERRLNPESLGKFLAAQPAARVALETGAHSAWVEALAQQLGHDALVANARELRAVKPHCQKTHRGRGGAQTRRPAAPVVAAPGTVSAIPGHRLNVVAQR
jgi:hypothetical protein